MLFVNFNYIIINNIDIIIWWFFVISIGCLFISLCYVISINNLYFEKMVGYECGFDPFSDARNPIHVKFYLISILFLIFDVEMIFFFIWIVSLNSITIIGYYCMFIFYVFLMLSFIFEIKNKVIYI